MVLYIDSNKKVDNFFLHFQTRVIVPKESAQMGKSFNEVMIWIPDISIPIDDFDSIETIRDEVVIPIEDDVWMDRLVQRGYTRTFFISPVEDTLRTSVIHLSDVKISIEDDFDVEGSFPPAKTAFPFRCEVSQRVETSRVGGPARGKRERDEYESRDFPL